MLVQFKKKKKKERQRQYVFGLFIVHCEPNPSIMPLTYRAAY